MGSILGTEKKIIIEKEPNLNTLLDNPGFLQINMKILHFLDHQSLRKCRLVNQSFKTQVDNPYFWIEKCHRNFNDKTICPKWINLVEKMGKKDSDLFYEVSTKCLLNFSRHFESESNKENPLKFLKDLKMESSQTNENPQILLTIIIATMYGSINLVRCLTSDREYETWAAITMALTQDVGSLPMVYKREILFSHSMGIILDVFVHELHGNVAHTQWEHVPELY